MDRSHDGILIRLAAASTYGDDRFKFWWNFWKKKDFDEIRTLEVLDKICFNATLHNDESFSFVYFNKFNYSFVTFDEFGYNRLCGTLFFLQIGSVLVQFLN